MALFGRLNKGEFTFIKDLRKGKRGTLDSMQKAMAFEMEMEQLKNYLDEIMHDTIMAQTEKGVTDQWVKKLLTWKNLIRNGVENTDSGTDLHKAFTTLKKQHDELTEVVAKDPLNQAKQREWVKEIGKTALEMKHLSEQLIENSHQLAGLEQQLAKRWESLSRMA